MKKHLPKTNTSNKPKSFLRVHSKLGKAILISLAILIAVLGAFVLGLRIYYSNHWYPNTWIGDRDVSGMSCEDSMELMNYVYENYQLNITGRNDGSHTITQGEINYQVNIKDSVKEQFDAQHSSFPILTLGQKKQVNLTLNAAYDENKLSQLLKNSVLYVGNEDYPIVKPQDADVVFSKKKQYLVVQNEVVGNSLNLNAFMAAVKQALVTGHEKLDLTDETTNPDVYEKPQYVSTDSSLQQKAAACNATALRWFSWKIDKGVSETIGPKNIFLVPVQRRKSYL